MAKKASSQRLCLGAHMSVAGGLEKAVGLATDVGCGCVQIFTKNNNQWNCKPLTEEQIQRWHDAFKASSLAHPIAHASYLINLASPDKDLWQKSLDALVIEWQRCEQLRLVGLVVHPGAFITGSAEDGLQRISEAVTQCIEIVKPQHCRLLLENTAGQGSCLGHQINELGWLLSSIADNEHVGVCLDTCHAFAAGYEINSTQGFRDFKKTIKNELPAGTVHALHLNDSKKGCGSRVDRHEHIGQGAIGDEGFRMLLKDPLFRSLPGYLETPKGNDEETGCDFDQLNLERLRSLA